MIITKGTLFTDDVSDYEVIEQIGKGGFGAVWLAKNKKNDNKYAIKTLLSDFRDDDEFMALTNEIKMATQVSSSNVIKYFYTHDGNKFPELPPYIIMEYAENGSLSELLKERKQSKQHFSNDGLMKLFLQLAYGMSAINSKLVHRDIKPDNILIHKDLLKISDLGLCKLACEQTRTMSFKGGGTYPYMSPEAWDYTKNTKQMDIYSMGIVFYELATLSYPYDISNGKDYYSAYHNAHMYAIPKAIDSFNKNITPALSSIIMKMLEKRTDKRYKEWSEILAALSNLNAPSNFDNSIVDNMLNIQLARDNAKKTEESKRLKRDSEIKAFCEKVSYQYKNDIIAPLTTLVDDFNMKSQSGKIIISHSTDDISTAIRLPSGKSIKIQLQPIIEEDFVRKHKVDDMGRIVRDNYYNNYNNHPYESRTITRVEIPHYKNDRVLAWGGLYASDGQGYNLLLLEQKDEIYGKWLFIINTNSGLSREPRKPEPFAFQINELEKEVPLMNVTHKYISKPMDFDEKILLTFVMNNL